MTVLTYLEGRARRAILSAAEESSINTSAATLRNRISSHFGLQVADQFRFGSSTRGTILPRSMDEHSDIDYMVVFADDGSTPQTLLDRVKRFAEKYYASSDIKQTSPSISLELNHIKFDLVPALKAFVGYRIVGSGGLSWQDTNPNDFNSTLTAKNTAELHKIKPTIRLAKIWNAKNWYLFDSFKFEKWIVEQYFGPCISQTSYLFKIFDNMNPYLEQTQWRRERVERAKTIVEQVRSYEANLMPVSAEQEVKKLIPE